MKTQIRLNSIVPFGVGSGSESIALDLIYSNMLNKFEQNEYSYIGINQINGELRELIMKKGKRIYINIIYPTYKDFEIKSTNEKNRIRLDIIHESLIRIAKKYKKFNINSLEAIKKEILRRNFSFDFLYKTFKYKKRDLSGELYVHPEINKFKFFLVIKDGGFEKCKLLIYESQPAINIDYFFSFGKWKNEKEIIITGKEKQVAINIKVDKCKVVYVNLTKYDKPPLFEMMKADISKEDKEKAYQNWIHSLPPAIASVLRDSDN
jgi:hypothetical protein